MNSDVVIVGGGPVGLFLAAELRLQNVSVTVLEKSADPHTPAKSGWMGMRGVNELSISAFRRRGLVDAMRSVALIWDEAEDDGSAGDEARFTGHFATVAVDGAKVISSPDPYALRQGSVIVSIADLETVLADRARSLGAVIRRGIEVTDVRQSGEAVAVEAGGEVFRAGWVVGCDGARSIVRKKLDFEFAGTEPLLTGYLASATITDSTHALKPGFTLTPTGVYVLGPGPGRVVAMEFDGGAAHRRSEVTREQFQSVLRRVTGTDVTVDTFDFASTYTDRARQATTYRQGRALLAGDAAHIHSPLGAQGLNTGLIDALNLGWKLAAVIKGTASQTLLDTYTSERYPAGAWALAWTRAQVTVMRPDPWGHAIHEIVRDLIDTPDGATYFARKMSGTWRRYDLPGDHPLVGRPAPDLAFTDGTRLEHLLSAGGTLLLDLGAGHDWTDLQQRYEGRLAVATMTADDDRGLAALLIRPDGIVSWAADRGATIRDATVQDLAREWLGTAHATAG